MIHLDIPVPQRAPGMEEALLDGSVTLLSYL